MVEKVALIGAEGYRSSNPEITLDCFPWHRLRSVQNLSDYDTVILNVLSEPRLNQFDSNILAEILTLQTMTEILGHHGMIVVLGDPRFDIQSDRNAGQDDTDHSSPFLDWSGLVFGWDRRAGNSVSFNWVHLQSYDNRKRFRNYLSNLKDWNYSLRSFDLNQKYIPHIYSHYLNLDTKDIDQDKLRAQVQSETFCTNRFGGILSASFNIVITARNDRRSSFEYYPAASRECGPLVLLPRISLDEDESLRTILRDACGIETTSPPPSWVITMVAPKQEAIDAEISLLRSQILEQVEQLERKEEEREEIRRPLRLLFAQHDDLEDAVRQVFADLGATVDLPAEPNKEDGVLTVRFDNREAKGILEVKGAEKAQFEERGLRQLREWMTPWIERGESCKGIFVGNASANKPPLERPNPFRANFIRNAATQHFVLIKSEDLFTAYRLKVFGLLDHNEFWRQVFETDGVFDAAGYLAMLASAR